MRELSSGECTKGPSGPCYLQHYQHQDGHGHSTPLERNKYSSWLLGNQQTLAIVRAYENQSLLLCKEVAYDSEQYCLKDTIKLFTSQKIWIKHFPKVIGKI